MSEARKLDPSTAAATQVRDDTAGAPPISGPLDPNLDLETAAHVVDVAVTAAPRTAHLEEAAPRPESRASGTLLILFVIGLLAFLCGIALASAVLLGVLDAGWVKDALRSAKETLQHLKGS